MRREASPDERYLTELVHALHEVGLEAIVVGATAAVLQGAPVMTQDIDLLVRTTKRNEEKIAALANLLGGSWFRVSQLSSVRTLVGTPLQVDLLFDALPGGLRFESLKSRAHRLRVGSHDALVADLADVIASKRAADRPKDRVHLPLLEDTLRVRAGLVAAGLVPKHTDQSV
jgi:hypothetical protein